MNAQVKDRAQADNLTKSMIGSIQAINVRQLGDPDMVDNYIGGYKQTYTDYLNRQLISQDQFNQIERAAAAKRQEAQDVILGTGTGTRVSTESDVAKPTPRKSKYPSIDKTFQIMLGVNPDGQLGPITQSALQAYKKSMGWPDASNDVAFEALKREPQYASKTKIEYDDNADVYLTNRQLQKRNPQLQVEMPF